MFFVNITLLLPVILILLLLIQNENDPTILSGWRRVVPVEEFFEIISEVHCNEKGHIGSKKTVTEVRLTLGTEI